MPKKFGYYDMFAGPGMYEDGGLSTPLLVAGKCANDSYLRERVWMVFNDMMYGDTLKENFEANYPGESMRMSAMIIPLIEVAIENIERR